MDESTDLQIIAGVNAALKDWRPTPSMGTLAKRVEGGWLIGGYLGDDQYIKHTGIAPDGPDTPDDPIAAAEWLDAHAKARRGAAGDNTLALGAELLAGEGEAGPRTYDEATEEYFAEHPEDAVREAAAPLDGGSEGLSGADEIAEAEAQNAGADVPIDADFTDADGLDVFDSDTELADVAADFIAIEGQHDDIAVEEPQPTDPGGVAYFGDNIHTIKLAKMGRLSQIARAAKEALQAGWTLAEFASLQNLIVRIDRGEAPDDPEARARFMAISERSAAMARVDAYREQREGELEEADRPGIEAFDPEVGWPSPEGMEESAS